MFGRAPEVYSPIFLKQKWKQRMDSNLSVERFISDMREELQAPELNDVKSAANYAALFLVSALQRFEVLVGSGHFDATIPRLPGLPVLYSPYAGKGAKQWSYAVEICERKRLGSDSPLAYRNADSKLARNSTWRHLAYDAVWISQQAVLEIPIFMRLMREARPCFGIERKISKLAKNAMRANVFILPGNNLLIWPSWLDACHAIARTDEKVAVPVRMDESAYLRAAEAIVADFFADPDNQYAEKIITEVAGSRLEAKTAKDSGSRVKADFHRSQAVAEARKNILAAVRQL